MTVKPFSGGDKLQAHLAELSKKVTRAAEVRVGFLEGSTEPDGQSTPMVAAIDEFGAPARGQPPRPYFRNMIAKEKDHWGNDVAKILPTVDYDAEKALALMGEEIKGELVESIQALTSPPLAPSTVAQKGFDKPLIETGTMWQSADYEVKT